MKKTLGSITNTLQSLPASHAQSLQHVTDLKKATEASAKELQSLKDTHHQLSQQLGESLTAANSASSKQIAALEKEVTALKTLLTSLNQDVGKVLASSHTPILKRLADTQTKILEHLQESNFLSSIQKTFAQGSEAAGQFYKQGGKQFSTTYATIEKGVKSGKYAKQVNGFLEKELYSKLRPSLPKIIPEAYHQYIFFGIVGIVSLLLGILTFTLLQFLICKPIGYLCSRCCRRKQPKKVVVVQESTTVTVEEREATTKGGKTKQSSKKRKGTTHQN